MHEFLARSKEYAAKIPSHYRYTVLALPTRSLNALIHRIPDTDHFLFIFDDHFPTFLHSISKIAEYAAEGQSLLLQRTDAKDTENPRQPNGDRVQAGTAALARPAALLLDLFFTFLRTSGKIGSELHPFGGDITSDILASAVRDHMYRFVCGHEIGHLVNGDLEVNSDDAFLDVGGVELSVSMLGWEKEHAADLFAVARLIESINMEREEEVKGNTSFLWSLYNFFEAFSLYERFANYIYRGKYAENVPASATHPPAAARLERVGKFIDGHLGTDDWSRYARFGLPPSVELAIAAGGLRSAWLLNEATILPERPDLKVLRSVWLDIKRLNERNADGYVVPERPSFGDKLFENATSRDVVSDRDRRLGALKAELEQREAEVLALTETSKPSERAAALRALGNARFRLGFVQEGVSMLEAGLQAHRDALKLVNREEEPTTWARTQFNIGVALQELGRRSEGVDRFLEAEAAYRLALDVRTPSTDLVGYARTQTNLGITLLMHGEREHSLERLREAVAAMDYAINALTRAKLFEEAGDLNRRRKEAVALIATPQAIDP